MADFPIRNNIKTQYTPAEVAKLSRMYGGGNNLQNIYTQQVAAHHSIYGPRVVVPSGNRKHSLPQQLSMTSGLQAHAISDEILRQHRGNQLPILIILILSSSSKAPGVIKEPKRAKC
jgi:hypothetical protein